LEPVSLEEIIDRVLHNLAIAIEEARATINRPEALPVVHGDSIQLEQLFQNLVSNALKFRSEVTPVIEIGVDRQDDCWLVSVRDNGIGIKPENFERIFVIFQRLHSQDKYAGTGIGLAICKKIIERHEGEMWVESAPGEGTTFFFTLPVIETDLQENESEEHAAAG
jgi:light-regulated signal transduction histidine kinase (bacteriophytochrome)